MRHREKRKYAAVRWPVVLLLLLGLLAGGVSAYLLLSAEEPVTNSFSTDAHPVITVNGYRVTVDSANYPVYLRAAVVVNWKTADGGVLAVVPTGYDLDISDEWKLHDGFYYYPDPVWPGDVLPPVIESLTAPAQGQPGFQADCTLAAELSVQAVQAVGSADDGKTAAEDAWDIALP